jgi:predicted MPP superfamily phosphohydrolase
MPLSRKKFVQMGLLSAAGFVLADAFWFEKWFVQTKEFFLNDATPQSDTIRVVQISDLHIQKLNYPLYQIAKTLSTLRPELILLTGDSVDKAENLPILNSFLELLDKNIPKVAILGNWEYWGKVNLEALKTTYAAHNCELLVNQTRQLRLKNKTLAITGIDDFLGGRPDYPSAVQAYQPSDYHLVLTHCPEHRDTIAREQTAQVPIDLVLSGHTHGGQFNFFGYVPFKPRGSGKYLKGWYADTYPKLYVSKGIGTSILPARFGARAEITVFHLKS